MVELYPGRLTYTFSPVPDPGDLYLEEQLFSNLTSGYNRHVRPAQNHTQAVRVNVGVSLTLEDLVGVTWVP